MSAHIHTYTYIHTRIQNVHMNARKARLKLRRGSDCAGSPTWHQEALPFSLSASRQRAVQTTSAYLDWCGADPPSSLSTPAPSLAMPAHGPPTRGHFSAILAGFFSLVSGKKVPHTPWYYSRELKGTWLWDSKWSSEHKTKSSMVKVEFSFQMSHLKRNLWWPSRISFCIPMTISSLMFSETGCISSREQWRILE